MGPASIALQNIRMANTPRLLDQLSALTAIRDLDLLEYSLLKTIHYSFRPRALVLLRLNQQGMPLMEIRFGESHCEVRHDDITMPGELAAAVAFLRDSDAREYAIRGEGMWQTVCKLHSWRSSSIYLVITTDAELPRQDAHLVFGMLQIYRNFCGLLRESQTETLRLRNTGMGGLDRLSLLKNLLIRHAAA